MAVTSVSSTTSAVQLAATDTTRDGFIITNTDANALYVLMDSGTPSSSNYSLSLATGESFGASSYRGEIRGVWAADGSGAALVTTWGD